MTAYRAAIALVFAGTCLAQQYTISTVAGGVPGSTPNFGTSVSLGSPQNITLDSGGSLYFTSANCVFQLTINGVLSRIAGNSRAGYSGDGGPGANAQLSSPIGIAFDSAGNMFIADSGNNRVREVDVNGIITTVAGSAAPGFSGDGGSADSARITAVSGVAVDTAGNLYIADTGNNRIRKVSTSGIITTVAGNGSSTFAGDGGQALNAQLSATSIAVDAAGDLFIGDGLNNRIREVLTDGSIVTLAGSSGAGYSGDGGQGVGARLNAPGQVSVDSLGNVYIADTGNHAIRKVASGSGTITTIAGNGQPGFFGDGVAATQAALWSPAGVALDTSGDIFICDTVNNRVRIVRSDGTISTIVGTGQASFSGDGGSAVGAQLSGPRGVGVDKFGNIFVADTGNNRIREILTSGVIGTVAGTGTQGFSGEGQTATKANISLPEGVAVDASNNIFVADTGNNRVREIPDGTITTIAGNGNTFFGGDGGPATAAGLSVAGIAIDASGNVFIGDPLNLRVRELLVNGNIATVIGNDSGQLGGVAGVAVSSSGDVYFADPVKHSVWKVSGGVLTRVAGTGSAGFSGDGGPAVSAKLFNPTGIAVDSAGNLFIADTNNNRVRLVSTSGTILTIAGTGAAVYSGDGGSAAGAALSGPRGLAIGKGGIVYVADTGNDAIRLLTPVSQTVIISSVVDAASESAIPLTPGKIAVIYGTVWPAQLVVNQPVNGVFSQQVAGTTIAFRGVNAPIYYTSANQVAAIVPYEVSGSTSVPVQISYNGALSLPFNVSYAATAPGIFTANATGAGEAAAINVVDGTLNSAANPVKTGAYISLYATGEGLLTPGGFDGKLAPLVGPFPAPVAKVTATIGGVAATVAYAGVVPGTVEGLMQINVLIPPALAAGATNPTPPTALTPGPRVPVVLKVGNNSTVNGAVWIAVAGLAISAFLRGA